MLGIVLTDKKAAKVLLTEDNFLIVTGLSGNALRQCDKDEFIKPEKSSDGINYYSEESADLAKAMMGCLGGRCANLREAYEMALQATSLKKRRNEQASVSNEGDNDRWKFMDPNELKTDDAFKDALRIDKKLLQDITNDMALNSYRPSEPIFMGTWPGQEEPVVIDGHTRRQAAIDAGVPLVPVVIEEFASFKAASEEFVKSQTKRRPTDQWILYQLIIMYDSPMDRGGDRRSEQAKSKRSQEPIETSYSNSTERTAAVVGCKASMVKRARRIRDHATSQILNDLKNRKITISQAEKEIAKLSKATKTTAEESPVAPNQDAMVCLTDENLAGLKELGGNRHDHVNKAVEQYIVRELRKRASSEQEDSDSDEQKPRIIQ
jgi:hypothetical protein